MNASARTKPSRTSGAARAAAVLLATAGALAASSQAHAFCGFYVSGADAHLTNNATQVVLMRSGTRTVLAMQNAYQGPPQDFAMVVPVPIVLQKENVRTLPRDVFDRVDQLTAPRLVEYWEQDPCQPPTELDKGGRGAPSPPMPMAPSTRAAAAAVKIEAQFTVGEYDVVVLSATDSTALDTWLRQNHYKIPHGAEPYLRPYVQMGMKFFVAKVDVTKVTFQHVGSGPDQAVLSPLRFHYDSDAFSLPIRLGLINSSGTQDLVVTILSPDQRYEVANYDNVAIPTNIDVLDSTRASFPAFYAALFDDTVRRHPRAVVTEYSWSAESCDPCPTPPLGTSDLLTLGQDVLATPVHAPPPVPIRRGVAPRPSAGGASILPAPVPMPTPPPIPWVANFVITRLHARYSKEALGDDLTFRAAPPIVGGREFMQNDGKLEQGARPDSNNNFQARYAIRHPWTGPLTCSHPQRGVWGGPPGQAWNQTPPQPAAKIGFQSRAAGVSLAAFVTGAIPPESVLSGSPGPLAAVTPPGLVDASGTVVTGDAAAEPGAPADATPAPMPSTAPSQGGCAGCASAPRDTSSPLSELSLAALVGLVLFRPRWSSRRRRGQHGDET